MIKEYADKIPGSLIFTIYINSSVQIPSFVVLLSSDSMLTSSKTSDEVELLPLPCLPSSPYFPNMQ